MNTWIEIYNFIINNKLIMLLLALDTCRAFIAAWGIIPRDFPFFGRIVYGKRDEDLLKSALLQLGYKKQETQSILKRFRNQNNRKANITDPVGHLLNILAQYTYEFESNISFGAVSEEKRSSNSRYYVSTMDAVHDPESLKTLTIILSQLITKYHKNNIDFILVPKGGNPTLAQNLASTLNINLIISKDKNDNALPSAITGENDKELLFGIRYEGAKKVLGIRHRQIGIIVDDNTSDGDLLKSTAEGFNEFISVGKYNIQPIKDIFVLFKLVRKDESGKEIKIEESFTDLDCKIHSFFDLEETDRKSLYDLEEGDYYLNKEKLATIANNIREKSHLYYE